MEHELITTRPFIGATDFEVSRNFYRDLGFEETALNPDLSVFQAGEIAFYLQNGSVKDWTENSMIFFEVDDVDRYISDINFLDLTSKYQQVRLTTIKTYEWGKECFVHDPSGILLRFGAFYQ